MLMKLLKYDLKYMFRSMSAFYLLSVFFAVTTRLLTLPEPSVMISILSGISTGCLISMIANIVINTMMRSWVHFRNYLYRDEAYLTHTLPVTKNDLYDSKFIQALLFFFVGFAVCVLSLFIAYYTPETWTAIKAFIKTVTTGLNMSTVFFAFITIFIIFLELFNAIQCGFMGIILGHGKSNGKVGFSVLYGFLIYLIAQSIVLGLVFVYGLFDARVMELFQTGATQIDVNAFNTLAVLASLLYVMIIVAMSFICKRFFSKGVDLE